ncbi:hypothetical protein [Streptomyces actinomycinicus]
MNFPAAPGIGGVSTHLSPSAPGADTDGGFSDGTFISGSGAG